MTMSHLEKELVALSISVAIGCRPCVTHHLVEARQAGADDGAVEMAIAGALCVRKAATESMRRHALGLEEAPPGCGCTATDRRSELIALGAALAVNCTGEMAKHLTAARSLGVDQDSLDRVFELSHVIRRHALGHAEAAFHGLDAHRLDDWSEAPKTVRCC